MKKTIKYIIIILIAIVGFNIINSYNVYASFADYSDEDARNETEKLIQEQKQNFDTLKSNNNYLKDLEVKGYKISPRFDKQILNYTLNTKKRVKEITIKATADDEKAKINGIGKIKIDSNQKECRVEVTAESGTVRTYIIKLTDDDNQIDINTNEINNIEENNKKDIKSVYSNKDKNNNKNVIIITIVSASILVALLLTISRIKIKKIKK